MFSLVAGLRSTVKQISVPVWRILAHSALLGLSASIADLLFNFYLVSLGYGNDVAGVLSTINRVAAVVLGLPIGLLIDRAGARRALMIGATCYALGWILLLVQPAIWMLVLAQFIVGAALITAQTAVVPLLTMVTTAAQRPRVFGFNASAAAMIGLLGNAAGGLLPGLAARLIAVEPQSSMAYRISLGVVVLLGFACLLPMLRPFQVLNSEHPADLSAAQLPPHSTKRLLRLALPSLYLGIAAGMILPFQNLFFRQEFGLSDAVVGIVLASASLGMGLGALLGGQVSARLGVQRAASWLRFCGVPMLLLMMVPWLPIAVLGFFLRGLFAAASYPQSDALTMQITPPSQRGIAFGWISIGWAAGWALASTISGWVQLRYGFSPVLLAAAIAFGLSGFSILTLRVTKEPIAAVGAA